MPKLRDLKKSWTLTDFLEMDEEFIFKFARAKEEDAEEGTRKSNMCLSARLHAASINEFTGVAQAFGWNRCRAAILCVPSGAKLVAREEGRAGAEEGWEGAQQGAGSQGWRVRALAPASGSAAPV